MSKQSEKFLQKLAEKLDLIILFITHENELVSKYGQNNFIEIILSENRERTISVNVKS